jgi:hypothetical protein
MKAVRLGNVLFVTSESRAEKLRKEEAAQPQLTLTPNGAVALPAMGIPGIGVRGIFGGVQVAPGFPVVPPDNQPPKP